MELTWTDCPAPAQLERQWTDLRKSDGETHSRALSLNLICRAHDAADAQQMAQRLWNLGLRHPARVFLISPSSAAGKAAVRLAAHPRGSEMVELVFSPDRAPSWVTPLLATDLPVVLLWRGPQPGASHEFDAWTKLADRVLVDAHRMRLGAADLAALSAELRPGAHLTDLTWTRLTPWRQLLCQGLETAPDACRRIARVSITTGAQTGRNLAATLLAGWLARQLQWKPGTALGPQALQLDCSSGASPVELRFQQCAEVERRGLLRRISVEGQDNGMRIEIEHHGQHLAMTVHRGGELVGTWAGPASGITRSEPETLDEELSIHGSDPLYQRALDSGLAIVARLQAIEAPKA